MLAQSNLREECRESVESSDGTIDLFKDVTDSVNWCNCYYGKDHVFMHNAKNAEGELAPFGDYDGRCRGWYQTGIFSQADVKVIMVPPYIEFLPGKTKKG